MKKTIYPFMLLALLLLVSCKSKKNVVSTLPRPVLNMDSVSAHITDTTVSIAGIFTPDHSQLKDLDVSKNKTRKPKKQESVIDDKHSDWVLRGTKITSSATKLSSAYAGIDRVVNYDFTHRDVPEAFEGFRIAFISDLHYKSLFKEQGLNSLVNLLIAQKADVLLMGGDYQEGCEYVEPLFAALSRVKTPMGTYGVMGNNDYERCHDDIVRTMEHYGMRVLEHKVDTLRKDGQQILIAGVRNPFDLARNGVSPSLALSPKDFVILLVHTPDYIEDVSIANTDLALAGHTHGGQVRIFGVAPILPSHYGNRFVTGLAYNSAKIPLIVTNGIGTSQVPIRIGAPAEIVVITLHRLTE
ncbi:metallophosphoesterase [Bacteroides acidifaciens]|uniref:metallophosphoesterase n=1 Tax=Bacteroides acidifaciens TaxID=85831 RepID=UPI00214C29EA|nr:metallophosphoesterase [Bacteroides acidifaciens]MCR1997698.1 metallophosphoesterase [Bacteroides acidifaciens]